MEFKVGDTIIYLNGTTSCAGFVIADDVFKSFKYTQAGIESSFQSGEEFFIRIFLCKPCRLLLTEKNSKYFK